MTDNPSHLNAPINDRHQDTVSREMSAHDQPEIESVTQLLTQARQLIQSGECSLHAAAEKIAAAEEQEATQRQIAQEVGKSVAWVNRLLAWRKSGYQGGTAFGPQAKASRRRAKAAQTTEQKRQNVADKPRRTSEQGEVAASSVQGTAKAEAVEAEADSQAKAEVPPEVDAHMNAIGGNRTNKTLFGLGQRELLVQSLGTLGSDQADERACAALIVEEHRAKLGMTWDELIVSADEAKARAA
jgi:hypothetical protein